MDRLRQKTISTSLYRDVLRSSEVVNDQVSTFLLDC